jgi:hypothetical protein
MSSRPRTDVIKLRDAKVLYENSGKTADEVCKVVGSAGAASLLISLYSETSHQHPSLPIRPFRGLDEKSLDELGPDLAVEIADLLDCRDARVILR